jgi:NADPH:quinone reductase-like Zn-dependent oxidoreductase
VTDQENTMKAIVYHEYGSPDVLELQEIDKPVVKDGDVLVRVRAASANPADWHYMRGLPYIMRPGAGLRRPKQSVLGRDISGQVEEVGKDVRGFARVTRSSPKSRRVGSRSARVSRKTSWC